MRFEKITDSIGHTPLVRLNGSSAARARLYGKLELMNPFGMKDRFALHAVRMAKATGELKDGGVIVESSSGTLALGLALVGRALGHEVHIITDPRIDEITLAKLRTLNAVVHIVQRMNESGWQGARLERLQQVMSQYPGAFWPRQYSNVCNPQAYTALAQELITDVGHVDILVGSVGSGGSLSGTARALKTYNPQLRVVGVDAVGSAIFGQPDTPGRLQSGLGNSLVPPNVDKTIIDEVHWLNDEEAFTATLRLVADEQIFAGNSSGSAYWVARWLSTQAPANATIVTILPDRGDRYYNSIYNADYREAKHIAQGRLPDAPVEVPFGTTVHSWSWAALQRSEA